MPVAKAELPPPVIVVAVVPVPMTVENVIPRRRRRDVISPDVQRPVDRNSPSNEVNESVGLNVDPAGASA